MIYLYPCKSDCNIHYAIVCASVFPEFSTPFKVYICISRRHCKYSGDFKVDSHRNHSIKRIFYIIIAVRSAFCHQGIRFIPSTHYHYIFFHLVFLSFNSIKRKIFKLKCVNLLRKLFITSFRILMRTSAHTHTRLYKMESACVYT